MNTPAASPYICSGIITDALTIIPGTAAEGTHFIICKGEQMRYIIAKGGERALARSAVAYGGKAALLLKLLSYLPKRVLTWAHLGFWATVDTHDSIKELIPHGYSWNVLIGTYCDKQKLVFQCYKEHQEESLFVKIGNVSSESEMRAEMHFLQKSGATFRHMELPQMEQVLFRSETCPFNIMVTREFHGHKAGERLSQAIVNIWQEISALKQTDGDTGHLEFSHGDFAPWNLRCTGKRHIVFDWEHCGMKPHGYDLLYWAVVTRLARCGMSFDAAYEAAVEELRHYDVHPAMTKKEFYRLFTEVITPDGF